MITDWLARLGRYCLRLKTQIAILIVCSAALLGWYPHALQYYTNHDMMVPKYWNWIVVANKFAFATILAFIFVHEGYKAKFDKARQSYEDPTIDMLSSAIVYGLVVLSEAILMGMCIGYLMTAVG